MKCTDIFEAMTADLQSDVRQYLRGNTGQYLCQNETDENGVTRDVNAVSRIRLCYALAFGGGAVPARAEMLRTLFDAECAAQETGSLRGSSSALVLLTAMLKETEPADSPLFERAKHANTFCADFYDAEDCRLPETLTPAQCMAAASAAGLTSYLITMLGAAKQEVPAAEYAELRRKFADAFMPTETD